jgi:hypothetical protein
MGIIEELKQTSIEDLKLTAMIIGVGMPIMYAISNLHLGCWFGVITGGLMVASAPLIVYAEIKCEELAENIGVFHRADAMTAFAKGEKK